MGGSKEKRRFKVAGIYAFVIATLWNIVAYGLVLSAGLFVFGTRQFATSLTLFMLGFVHTTTMIVAIQAYKLLKGRNF